MYPEHERHRATANRRAQRQQTQRTIHLKVAVTPISARACAVAPRPSRSAVVAPPSPMSSCNFLARDESFIVPNESLTPGFGQQCCERRVDDQHRRHACIQLTRTELGWPSRVTNSRPCFGCAPVPRQMRAPNTHSPRTFARVPRCRCRSVRRTGDRRVAPARMRDRTRQPPAMGPSHGWTVHPYRPDGSRD